MSDELSAEQMVKEMGGHRPDTVIAYTRYGESGQLSVSWCRDNHLIDDGLRYPTYMAAITALYEKWKSEQ